MAVPTDFELLLFNKDRQYLAPVSGYISLSGTARYNALSAATLQVHPGHKRAAALQAPGSRLIINFRGRTLMSGKTLLVDGEGPGKDSHLSFEIEDDFRIFTNFLGWPVPANAISNQNAEYHTLTGAAETVAKTLVTANVVPRAVYPVTVVASAGRGATITAMLRFDYLAEKLFPAVDFAGVGMTAFLLPDGSSIQVDAFTPTDRTATPLTVASRVIQGYKFGVQAPTATGGVLGGQGEGVLRDFRTFEDAAREAAWGDTIEVFRDARDTSDAAVWTKREAETLGEGAPQYWAEVKLAEAGKFRIGGTGGYWLGDKVTADVGVIAPITDVLREITYSVTTEGVKLGATVGRKNDPEEATMKAIATLTRGLRELRRSR
jgi:hypothetical protein